MTNLWGIYTFRRVILLFKFKRSILMFCCMLFFYVGRVNATTVTDQFKETFIGSYSFVDTKGKWGNFEYFQRKSDGQIAYCIEPGIPKSNETYVGKSDLAMSELSTFVHLTEEQLFKVSLIAYFGYGYQGNVGNEWIVATQSLIWKETGRDFQFTSRIDANQPSKYIIDTPKEIQEKMAIIERNVALYLRKPDVDQQHLKIAYGSSYFYQNDFLEGYEIKKSQNATTINYRKNEIVITPHSFESGNVLLQKELKDWSSSFIVYASDKGQNMLVPGNLPPLNVQFDFEVVRNVVHLKKYDAINKRCEAQLNSSLVGSVYGLYSFDGYHLDDLIIGEDCSAHYYDLSNGKYYIQETKAGTNYALDSNKYYFEFKENQFEHEIISYENLLMSQIRIQKRDSKTKSCLAQGEASLDGAIYGIYKKDGTLIDELVLQDCEALSKKELVVGEYYIKEIKAPKGYKLDNKKYSFEITSSNVLDILEIEVFEQVYETRLTLNKFYFKYGLPLKEEGAKFEIYFNNQLIDTIVTNKNGEASIDLPYGKYVIKQTKSIEGTHVMNDMEFVVDEHSDEKEVLTIYNPSVKGSVQLLKVDAATEFPLAHAKFQLCRETGECFKEMETNEEGILRVDDLDYGSYYFQEIKAPKGYALNNEKLYFHLSKDGELISLKTSNEQEVMVPSTSMNKKQNYGLLFLFVLGVIFYKKKI